MQEKVIGRRTPYAKLCKGRKGFEEITLFLLQPLVRLLNIFPIIQNSFTCQSCKGIDGPGFPFVPHGGDGLFVRADEIAQSQAGDREEFGQ